MKNMFIGQYKSVNSPDELFSLKRDSLDFPTQIEYNGQRYLLTTTHFADSPSREKRLKEYAKKNSIIFDISI